MYIGLKPFLGGLLLLQALLTFSTTAVAAPPVADFTVSPQTGVAPLDINLDATASSDPDGTAISQYSWTISGPGLTRSEITPNATLSPITLPQAGSYSISLTVTSGADQSDPEEKTVVVTAAPPPENKTPTASFTVSSFTGEAPLAVTFTSTITDGNGPSEISWNFGDGSTSTVPNPTHTYTKEGVYNVTLTVTDSGDTGANPDTYTTPPQTITVQAPTPAPVPDFEANADPNNPQTVFFKYTGKDGKAPLRYVWLFGDGGGSDEQNPTHSYDAPGTYVITLQVTDANQNFSELQRNITVRPNNVPPVTHDDFVNVISGEEIIIDVIQNDEDENKAGLQLLFVGDPPHGTTQVVDGRKIKYVSDDGYTGQDAFDYTVRDDHGVESNGSTVTIQVARGNLPPTVTVPGNLYSNGGAVVTLEGSAVDPEGDNPVTYAWTQVSGDRTVEISNADQATATFTAPLVLEETILKFRLTATDALGASSFAEVPVKIGLVDPPVAIIDTPDQNVLEGDTVKLAGRGIFLGEDLTEDRRTLQWAQVSGPEVPISDPSQAEITFVAPAVDNTSGENPEVELQFQLTVTLKPDDIVAKSEPVTITVGDNGITGIAPDYIPTQSRKETPFGIKTLEGGLVELQPLPDSVITNNTNRPRRTPIGLIDVGVKTSENGIGVFQIKLLDPLPDDYSMFVYSDENGWTRLTEEQADLDTLSVGAYFLNPTRDVVTVKLQDVTQAPRAAGDSDAKPGLIKFRGGPGEVSYPVSGSATVSGGSFGPLGLLLLFLGAAGARLRRCRPHTR